MYVYCVFCIVDKHNPTKFHINKPRCFFMNVIVLKCYSYLCIILMTVCVSLYPYHCTEFVSFANIFIYKLHSAEFIHGVHNSVSRLLLKITAQKISNNNTRQQCVLFITKNIRVVSRFIYCVNVKYSIKYFIKSGAIIDTFPSSSSGTS